MSGITINLSDLDPVAQTLIIPLASRAWESQRDNALLHDPAAVALLSHFGGDIAKLVSLNTIEQASIVLRNRQFDRYGQAFLETHPDGMVVDIGCGLDTRFERLDNGQMTWFGLDLPEVIGLRKKLLPEQPRCQFLACSALDFRWMEVVSAEGRPVYFLSEGVLPYFEEADVKRLFLTMAERFPGSEIVFDGLSPLSVFVHQLTTPFLRKSGAHLGWAIRDNCSLESWGPLKMLSEWFYYEANEPRLGWFNRLKYFPPMGKMNSVLRYRLGDSTQMGGDISG
jgi:O-methyltransferase involved in polyketide biosynthesis